jgi:hypothetical protein
METERAPLSDGGDDWNERSYRSSVVCLAVLLLAICILAVVLH